MSFFNLFDVIALYLAVPQLDSDNMRKPMTPLLPTMVLSYDVVQELLALQLGHCPAK